MSFINKEKAPIFTSILKRSHQFILSKFSLFTKFENDSDSSDDFLDFIYQAMRD